MTDNKQTILMAVYQAMDNVNDMLPRDRQLTKAPTTTLMGDGSVLDSMGLINFVVSLESTLSDSGNGAVSLIEGAAIFEKPEALKSVASLVDYLATLNDR